VRCTVCDDLILDASFALQGFLEDETDRHNSLAFLANLSKKRAVAWLWWLYEVGNGLVTAHRRKRISFEQAEGFLVRLKALPIDAAPQTPLEIFELPNLARSNGLTNYDAAYLSLAKQLNLPLATTDSDLRKAANSAGILLVKP
jgi:predicted nucleic acid-binding protein